MNLDYLSVLEYGIDKTIVLLNEGFSDYIVPIQMDRPGFFSMVRMDGIDLSLSHVVAMNGSGVGVALIARRGWNSRLGAMSIIPEARGSGIGTRMVSTIIQQAKDRGDLRMELEVILGNEPAITVYQRAGFQVIRKLYSYKAENPEGIKSEFEILDIREIANKIAATGFPKLPWQLSAETIAHYGPPNIGVHKNSSWVVISPPEREQIYLRTFGIHPGVQDRNPPRDLLRALFAHYPHKTWNIPAIFPEELAVIFESVGFNRQTLSQYQMDLDLSTV